LLELPPLRQRYPVEVGTPDVEHVEGAPPRSSDPEVRKLTLQDRLRAVGEDRGRNFQIFASHRPERLRRVHAAAHRPSGKAPGDQANNSPRKLPARRSPTRYLHRAPYAKAEKEIAELRRFQTLAQQLIEVNQKICWLRPVDEETIPIKKGETLQQEISRELNYKLNSDLLTCPSRKP